MNSGGFQAVPDGRPRCPNVPRDARDCSDPGRGRTANLLLRRQALYPVELQGRRQFFLTITLFAAHRSRFQILVPVLIFSSLPSSPKCALSSDLDTLSTWDTLGTIEAGGKAICPDVQSTTSRKVASSLSSNEGKLFTQLGRARPEPDWGSSDIRAAARRSHRRRRSL